MLILTRRAGQKLQIGPDVELTVVRLKVTNGTCAEVVLGFCAPDAIRIVRHEAKVKSRKNADEDESPSAE